VEETAERVAATAPRAEAAAPGATATAEAAARQTSETPLLSYRGMRILMKKKTFLKPMGTQVVAAELLQVPVMTLTIQQNLGVNQ
jgi:hypothetical protein